MADEWSGTWLALDEASARCAVDALRDHGWSPCTTPLPEQPWGLAEQRLVLVSAMPSADGVGEVVLAASRGICVVLVGAQLVDPLERDGTLDALARLGAVREWPVEQAADRPSTAATGIDDGALEVEHRQLLDLLAGGASLAEAASALHVSLRTANRRLSDARIALVAPSNRAAVLAWKRRAGGRGATTRKLARLGEAGVGGSVVRSSQRLRTSKGDDMTWYDTNADGIGDTHLADNYGDGVADVMSQDLDQDGRVEAISTDSNNDGYIDGSAFDTDEDGRIDLAASDVDQNGVAEIIVADTNLNGVFDVIGADANQDGVLDQMVVDANENGVDDAVEVTSVSPSGVYTGVGASGEVIMSGPGVVGPATNPDPFVTLMTTLAAETGSATFGTPDSDHDGWDDNEDWRPNDPFRY